MTVCTYVYKPERRNKMGGACSEDHKKILGVRGLYMRQSAYT